MADRDEEERPSDDESGDSDPDSDRGRDDEDSEGEAEASAPPKRKKVRKKKKKARRERASAAPARTVKQDPQPGRGGAAVIAVVALAIGGGAGWFARDARANAGTESATGPASSAEPAESCQAWEDQLCKEGPDSAACLQAKSAKPLLSAAACDVALKDMPATLERVRASRAVCRTLVTKLCNDLGQANPTCNLVTDKSQSLPAERCKEMLEKYDEILAGLKAMSQAGAMRGGPAGMPPGMPPGAAPMPMPRGAPGGAIPVPPPAPKPAPLKK